jgi:hypothetical protein
MKRNSSVERLFPWLFFSREKRPQTIVPPRSVVRLTRADPGWDAARYTVGAEFRVGYYRRRDGPNCVWLVDRGANYVGTWDQASLLNNFEVVTQSDESDIYGLRCPPLQPL